MFYLEKMQTKKSLPLIKQKELVTYTTHIDEKKQFLLKLHVNIYTKKKEKYVSKRLKMRTFV